MGVSVTLFFFYSVRNAPKGQRGSTERGEPRTTFFLAWVFIPNGDWVRWQVVKMSSSSENNSSPLHPSSDGRFHQPVWCYVLIIFMLPEVATNFYGLLNSFGAQWGHLETIGSASGCRRNVDGIVGISWGHRHTHQTSICVTWKRSLRAKRRLLVGGRHALIAGVSWSVLIAPRLVCLMARSRSAAWEREIEFGNDWKSCLRRSYELVNGVNFSG